MCACARRAKQWPSYCVLGPTYLICNLYIVQLPQHLSRISAGIGHTRGTHKIIKRGKNDKFCTTGYQGSGQRFAAMDNGAGTADDFLLTCSSLSGSLNFGALDSSHVRLDGFNWINRYKANPNTRDCRREDPEPSRTSAIALNGYNSVHNY